MTQLRTNRRSTAFTLALALTAFACSSTSNKGAMSVQPTLDPELIPAISISPATWETCGDSCELSVWIDEPALEPLSFVFEYVGEGNVTVPLSATIAKGETQAIIDGEFATEPMSSANEGSIKINVVDQFENTYTVREWPVLQRPSIISGIRVERMPISSAATEHYYSCLVSVDLNEYEQSLSTTPAERDFEVTTMIKKQGSFDPKVTVTENISSTDVTVTPNNFTWNSNTPVMMIEVSKPKFPPMRRAYLEVSVSYGGDTATKTVALPTR